MARVGPQPHRLKKTPLVTKCEGTNLNFATQFEEHCSVPFRMCSTACYRGVIMEYQQGAVAKVFRSLPK